jgi:Ca2+-binding RTX toxin-like protein
MRFKKFAGAAALAWTLLAQPALGATVSLSNTNSLFFRAALGEINDVSVVEEPEGVFLISDQNAAITSQTPACTSISPNGVRCEASAAFVGVITRDGADKVDVFSGGALIIGGAGPDTLIGAGDLVTIIGGPGNDRLVGRGSDRQDILGGPGADSLHGGGNNDTIFGQGGDDVIRGGAGNDYLVGDWGEDDLGGGGGNDFLFGGALSDVLRGGPDPDRMFGNKGADVLYARDRTSDRVDGGFGRDRAQIDFALDRRVSLDVLF